MAEEKAGVRLEQCTFEGNDPLLLDSFEGGQFYSDTPIDVWDNEKEVYTKTLGLVEAEAKAPNWLAADAAFFINMQKVFTYPWSYEL